MIHLCLKFTHCDYVFTDDAQLLLSIAQEVHFQAVIFVADWREVICAGDVVWEAKHPETHQNNKLK